MILPFVDRQKSEAWARNKAMELCYLSGETLEQTGKRFGVTRQRVEQVLSKANVPRRPGGNKKIEKDKTERLVHPPRGSRHRFKTREGQRAWIESRRYIMAAMRLDGATTREISEATGFDRQRVQNELCAARKEGLFIPYGERS